MLACLLETQNAPSLPGFRALNSLTVSLIDIASSFTLSAQVFIPSPIIVLQKIVWVGGIGGICLSNSLILGE